MNNEAEQPVEAASSEPVPAPEPDPDLRPGVTGVAAKTEPKDILDGLINDLNNLILVLIAAVYYFDCFSLLFLVRFLGQNQSTIAGIRVVATTNIICILTHLFHSITQPAPREVWNHGGILVDFVGEKPASRFKLILLDFMIVGLQILYLALFYRKATVDGTKEQKSTPPVQDLEAEEAGISRADPPTIEETEEGVEMQSLLPDGSNDPGAGDGDGAMHNDTTIILRRRDFKEVFLNTARNTQSDESAAAVRRFLDRVNTVRARRAAQEARAATDRSAT